MEHGFWDYTCHGAGGMEWYQRDDYLYLLDDMAAARMSSLVVVVRWNTTGYRSRLPFLDQIPGIPVIDSDNELLRLVIDEAHRRAIKVRLGACVMIFHPPTFGGAPIRLQSLEIPGYGTYTSGLYDTDQPGLSERAAQIYAELVELFPKADGFVVELEDTGIEAPHRVPLYTQWAEENGRRPIDGIGRPYMPRVFNLADWRDYATHSRMKVLRSIQTAVRAAGFVGDLGMICETAPADYAVGQEVNLERYHTALPDWFAVTYEYNKSFHRYAMMDFCIETPKRHGLKVCYLPRGVMTCFFPLAIPLEESWRMDVEDIRRFQPDGVWWFGSGTKSDGCHVSESLLRGLGYVDGADARKALLRVTAGL